MDEWTGRWVGGWMDRSKILKNIYLANFYLRLIHQSWEDSAVVVVIHGACYYPEEKHRSAGKEEGQSG